eukprot:2636904-Pyramimonas_sp.AAC.1
MMMMMTLMVRRRRRRRRTILGRKVGEEEEEDGGSEVDMIAQPTASPSWARSAKGLAANTKRDMRKMHG